MSNLKLLTCYLAQEGGLSRAGLAHDEYKPGVLETREYFF